MLIVEQADKRGSIGLYSMRHAFLRSHDEESLQCHFLTGHKLGVKCPTDSRFALM